MPQSRGAHGDLLGAVGMAVEAGLADQELDAPAELAPTRARPRPRTSSSRRADAGAPPRRRRSARGTRRRPRAASSPHSPVVTPALAQAIDGSHDVAASLAPRARARRARPSTALASRAARQACERARSARPRPPGRRSWIAPSSPVESGDGSVSVQRLTPTTICSPRLDAPQRAGVATRPAARFM